MFLYHEKYSFEASDPIRSVTFDQTVGWEIAKLIECRGTSTTAVFVGTVLYL